MKHTRESRLVEDSRRSNDGSMTPDRTLRFPTFRFLVLGLLLGTIVAGLPMVSAWGQSFNPESVQPAVVTVDYFDARGLILRSSNGVILKEGLLIPYSALARSVKAGVRGWDGSTWSTDRLIALHPEVDLALLQLDKIPSYAVQVPQDISFTPNSDVTILRGPEGDGPPVISATLFGKFAMRGPDFLALSTGVPAAAPAFKPDGKLVGICFDLSEKGFSLSYLVTTASVLNILAGQGTAVTLASLIPPVPPFYHVSSEPEGLVFRGALLHTAGKSEDARNFINLALKKQPGFPDAHFWTGKILFVEKLYAEAAAKFVQAGESDSTGFHMAWHMAGAAQNQAGRYDLALQMYEKALEADPNSALTYCNMGGAYYNLSQLNKAMEAFNKSIELDSTYGLSYFNLGMLYNRQGQKAKAEETYQQLKQKNPYWAKRLRTALDS